MKKVISKEIDLSGRKLKLETGFLATQADASVVASWGETVVLCAVSTKKTAEDMGYFPLSVEYVEKYYAGGRITTQKFIKRESRPTDEAVLSGRAIDRAIRPLFPSDFRDEVQVVVTVLSFDGINEPLIAAFAGVSAALSISSVPWAGPIGVARIGRRGEQVMINPQLHEKQFLDLDLLVAAGGDKVVMIEAEAREIEDEIVLEGVKQAQEESLAIISLIAEFTKEAGKEKMTYSTLSETIEEAVLAEIKTETKKRIEVALFDTNHPWHEATGDQIREELVVKYAEVLTPQLVGGVFDKVAKEIMNDLVINQGKRVDGRKMDEIRPMDMKIGILPRTHGSAVFQRGGTQVLSVATLGPLSSSQTLEGMTGESLKRFMHHYNMSINPFATGEVKKIGSPNRRDIGHGNLVEKSLVNVLPPEDEFPYAIRVVSEVLGANASTSMASVCAATTSLLNSGVPLKNPVAGIAVGLLSNSQKFQVITDMQAVEDFYGEMDFKISGSKIGITAIQMDTKLTGLTLEIIKEAIEQGRKAREIILEKINEIIPSAGEISQYAPKIKVTHIKPEEIGMLIGPGGRNINGIIAATGAQIDIEDDGTVMISSTDEGSISKALEAVEGMFKTVQVGEIYEGKVVRLAAFGAFVEILPGKDGLVHISQMAPGRVEKAEDVVSVGQIVRVRVTDVSPEGKVGLSMLFGNDRKPEFEGRPNRPSGKSFGGRRPQRDFDRRRPSGGFRRDFGRDRRGRR